MKLKYIASGLAILLLAACAKEKSAGLNDDTKRYFDAWISTNHPGAARTPLGAYVISEVPGTGTEAGSLAYIRVNYTSYTLKGVMQATTIEQVARQNGKYDETNYYGPVIGYRGDGLEVLGAGLEEAVSTMKTGGKKTVVIPGWLSESERFYTEEEYIEKCSGIPQRHNHLHQLYRKTAERAGFRHHHRRHGKSLGPVFIFQDILAAADKLVRGRRRLQLHYHG